MCNNGIINLPAQIEEDLIKVLGLGKWSEKRHKWQNDSDVASDICNRLDRRRIKFDDACEYLRNKYRKGN